MKSYDETVDSVFDRIDKYNSEKIRRNKIITKAVVPACCFCLIALGGIGAWKSGLFKSGTPGAVPGQPVTSYDNAAVSPAESTSPNSIGSKRLCFANQINGVKSAAPLYLDPAKHYTENWSNAEVTAYMGADLFNLGAEYKYIGSSSHAVTFSSDGAIARDVINLKYHSKDADFTMSASKLGAQRLHICFKQQRDHKHRSRRQKRGGSVRGNSRQRCRRSARKAKSYGRGFQLRRGLLQGNSRKYINQRFL